MSINASKVRVILRWVHIVLGLVLLCYVYSPFHKYVAFQIAIKFVVIPLIVFGGIWLWKFNAFNKLFGIR